MTNWYVVGKYALGPHSLALSYGQKGEEKLSGAGFSDLSDSKARQVAFQTFGNAPITSTTLFRDPARGADPTGFGVGMIHTF